MPIMRIFCLVLLVALFASIARADEPKAPEVFGFAKISVTFTDGMAYPNAPVTAKSGDKTVDFTTGPEGNIMRLLPVGESTISVKGIEKKVIVEDGEVTEVSFKVERAGVLVHVIYPGGTDANPISMIGAYKIGNGDPVNVNAVPNGQGKYWFPDVPANATAFAAIVRFYEDFMLGNTNVREQWTFKKAENSRALTITAKRTISLNAQVVNALGEPLPNMALTGEAFYTIAPNTFWDKPDAVPASGTTQMNRLISDANGMVRLGKWFPGNIHVQLKYGGLTGEKTAVEVKTDGQTIRYTLPWNPRKVTQTVFGADGKPAPRAEVTALYSWKGKIETKSAVANADGVVVWPELPPVRVIVYGAKVPACVVTGDKDTFTAPLPAPAKEAPANLNVILTNIGKDNAPLLTFIQRNTDAVESMSQSFDPEDSPEGVPLTYRMYAGARFTFVAAINSAGPKLAVTSGIMPYVDDLLNPTITLPCADAINVSCHFTDTAGRDCPGVSRLRILPVSIDALSPEMLTALCKKAEMLKAVEGTGGSFSVRVPAPGDYRLLVDFFDEGNAQDSLTFTVTDKPAPITLKLPAPLCTVPAGTEVFLLPRTTPGRPQRLQAAAQADNVPVYGPADGYAALWYRDGGKLVMHSGLDKGKKTTLPLRLVMLRTIDKGGNAYTRPLRLTPILPILDPAEKPLSPEFARSESFSTLLTDDGNYRLNLWQSDYLLADPTSQKVIGRFTVPAGDGPCVLTARIDQSAPSNNRALVLQFPARDYDAARKDGTSTIYVTYPDIAGRKTNLVASNVGADPMRVSMPANASSFTINWLGVGVIADVQMPPAAADGKPVPVTLPEWKTGVTLSGKVLNPNGTPLAKGRIILGLGTTGSQRITLQTDADGLFSATGLPVGPAYLTADRGFFAGWGINLPAEGLKDVSFKLVDAPTNIALTESGKQDGAAWFISETGAVTRMPINLSGTQLGTYETLLAPGRVWRVDGDQGRTQYYAVDAITRNIDLRNAPAIDCPLGLFLPMTGDLQPGTLTLTGRDALAGITVNFPKFAWQLSPALGMALGQLDSVPPGAYDVTVETNRGLLRATVTVGARGGTAVFAP